MKSIISNEPACYRCKTTRNLQRHHIYNGAFRKKAEMYGQWVYLCVDCHTGSHGVHTTADGRKYWDELKRKGQIEFEKKHTRSEFIKIFGRNYLERNNENE